MLCCPYQELKYIMDSKLCIPAEKNRVLFVSSSFLFLLFFFCLPHPHVKSEISSRSPLSFGLPLFSFLYYHCVLKNHGRATTMPALVRLPTGQKERQNRLEKPGHLDQVTEVHSMTCSLALYQIHFTASSLSCCPVPTPGSQHRRDRDA